MNIFKKIIIILPVAAVCGILIFTGLKNESVPSERIITLSNPSEREAYLNIKGWDVTALSNDTIKIPVVFSEIYKNYSQIQNKQKLPLEDYKGREAERYIYSINNYNGNTEVYAELLICGEKLVGAALIEQKPDGFIKPIY